MRRPIRVSLKIVLVLGSIVCWTLFLRYYGFGIGNSILVISSVEPADLDQRVVFSFFISAVIAFVGLRQWISR